jgi:DNA-binding PadR family transcriptional regulator
VSSPKPTQLSYVILAAIGEHGATTPELIDMAGRGGIFWTSSPSQVYAEPRRLLKLGWVLAEKQPAKTRSRTLYRLTPSGKEALKDWLRSPAGFPKLQHGPAIRLFAGDLIDDTEILASLKQLRGDIERMQADVYRSIERAPGLPHRTRYLLLQQDLGLRVLQAHREWLDHVEGELGERDGRSPVG